MPNINSSSSPCFLPVRKAEASDSTQALGLQHQAPPASSSPGKEGRNACQLIKMFSVDVSGQVSTYLTPGMIVAIATFRHNIDLLDNIVPKSLPPPHPPLSPPSVACVCVFFNTLFARFLF